MKPETTKGARRLVPRRRRDHGRSDAPGAHRDPNPDFRGAEGQPEFDPAEFAEFLAADQEPVPVDPAFRERLRHELWGLVRSQVERRRKPPLTPVPDPERPGSDPKRPS